MFQFLLQLLKGNTVATHFSYSLLYICLAAVICNSLPLQSHIIPLISQVTIQLFRNPVLICHIGWLRIFQIFLPGISGSLEFKQTDTERESVCVARLAKYLSQHPSSKAQWKQQNKWANMALWGEGNWERLCEVIHWLIKCPVTEINHYIKYYYSVFGKSHSLCLHHIFFLCECSNGVQPWIDHFCTFFHASCYCSFQTVYFSLYSMLLSSAFDVIPKKTFSEKILC